MGRAPTNRGTTCTVDDCETGAYSRNMCKKHYTRLQRRGTTDLLPRPARRNAPESDFDPTKGLRRYIEDRRRRGIPPEGILMEGEYDPRRTS